MPQSKNSIDQGESVFMTLLGLAGDLILNGVYYLKALATGKVPNIPKK